MVAELALPPLAHHYEDLGALSIGYYSYDQRSSDDFLPLIDRLLPYEIWVLATPLYWYTMSAQAKTFIDRLSDLLEADKSIGRQLRGKSLAVISSGTDAQLPLHFDEPFRLTANYLGMKFLGTHYEQFDDRRMISANADACGKTFANRISQSLKS
jgi:multimeric flavodoxin WrbA